MTPTSRREKIEALIKAGACEMLVTTTGPKPFIHSDHVLKLEAIVRAAGELAEALQFYGEADNLEIESQGGAISGPGTDADKKNWRIGPPYLKSAEMGQTALLALARFDEALEGKP